MQVSFTYSSVSFFLVFRSNKLREDLLHSNEYIRGSTLRLLCKVKFVKILEPLVEVIMQNLSHHHSYVRRNAIMCIHSMVRSFGVELVPHAAEEIQKLLLVVRRLVGREF